MSTFPSDTSSGYRLPQLFEARANFLAELAVRHKHRGAKKRRERAQHDIEQLETRLRTFIPSYRNTE